MDYLGKAHGWGRCRLRSHFCVPVVVVLFPDAGIPA